MTTVDKILDLDRYRMVWYYEDGIFNILSLNIHKKRYGVTYDDCFEVHKCTRRIDLNKYLCPQKRGYSTQMLTMMLLLLQQ